MPNLFLYDANMIKYKTLPLYEENTLNFYVRTRKNPLKFKEFYDDSAILRNVMHAGNLWDTIKNIFKKGKKYTKQVIDYVDNSPILQTVKDIGFDVIKNKYGVDPNDYYNTVHDVTKAVVNDDTDIRKTLTDTTQSVLNTTRKNINDYFTQQKQNPNSKVDYKSMLKNYYTDIMKTVIPQEQKQTVQNNYDLMANGLELSGLCGMVDPKLLNRNLIKLLMVGNKTASGNYTINKAFKPILLKHGIKTLTFPKTLVKIADAFKGNVPKTGESKGRLYLGRGEESKTSKTSEMSETSKGRLYLGRGETSKKSGSQNKIDRYNEILKKLGN